MVKVFNNMIQGKGKVIAIAIALVVTGFSALLVMLTAINFFIKIAIIAAVAAIATCLALLVIKKIRAKKNDVSANNKKQPDVSGDDIDAGYGSGSASVNESEDEDKEDIEISPEEQEKTQFQVQEDLANARERERMERGWLGGSINALGEPINSEPSMDLCSQLPSKSVNKIPEVVMLSLPEHMDLYGNPLPDQVIYTENSHLVFESQKPKQDSYVPIKSLPDNMDLNGNQLPSKQDNEIAIQNESGAISAAVKSLPDSMDVLGNKLPYSPSTHVNMNSSPEQCAQKKLSATEWLLKNEPWVLKQCPVKMPATAEDIFNQRG